MGKLTAKQERFCQEYVIDLNATQAAIRAGYSEKTAKEQGSRLLTNVNLQKRITKLQKERFEKDDFDEKVKALDLNPKQKMFAELYVSKEFHGNGFECYCEVYDPDISARNWKANACSAASQILRNTKVCDYINLMLCSAGLTNEFVDKQILFLITQNADFTAKTSMIKEYNKMKKRTSDRLELTGKNGGAIKHQLTEAEIDKKIKDIEQRSKGL